MAVCKANVVCSFGNSFESLYVFWEKEWHHKKKNGNKFLFEKRNELLAQITNAN